MNVKLVALLFVFIIVGFISQQEAEAKSDAKRAISVSYSMVYCKSQKFGQSPRILVRTVKSSDRGPQGKSFLLGMLHMTVWFQVPVSSLGFKFGQQ